MRITLLMAINIAIIGCGAVEKATDHVVRTDYIDHRSPHVEDEFISHVLKFSEVCGRHVSMIIEWDNLDENVLGKCIMWHDGYREIHVDKTKWPTMTNEGHEELLFHELGHCVLDLNHDKSLTTAGKWKQVPKSIMYPYVFGDAPYYAEFKNYYWHELCGET